MNKLKYIFALFLILNSFMLSANTIDSVFIKLPEELAGLLSFQQRVELLEYAKIGDTTEVANRMGGVSRINYRNTEQEHIVLQLTENVSLDLKVFFINDSDYVVGAIHTVGADVKLSKIYFYTPNWTKIEVPMPVIQPADWYRLWASNPSLPVDAEVLNYLNANFLRYNFSKTNNNIEIYNFTTKVIPLEFQHSIRQMTNCNQPELKKMDFRMAIRWPNISIERF